MLFHQACVCGPQTLNDKDFGRCRGDVVRSAPIMRAVCVAPSSSTDRQGCVASLCGDSKEKPAWPQPIMVHHEFDLIVFHGFQVGKET